MTFHTCARAAKEARALERSGHQVLILQHVAASEEILYATELSSFYRTEAELWKRIGYFADWAEVIHVHNEPNWIVSAAAAARDAFCPLVPVIFDVHDLDSQRGVLGVVDKEETPAIHAADGFIFPSKGYQAGVRKIYNISGVPDRIIYSFCSSDDIVNDPLPRVNGLVYEGATVAELKHFNAKTPGYKHYRDYVDLAGKLKFQGLPFHMYGVRKEFQQPYINAGAVVHDMIRFPDMMKQLSRYDWGLCGHAGDYPQWQKAMPNKLFEYIAAGIPVISINAHEVSELVAREGLGVVCGSVEEIAKTMRDRQARRELAENVEDRRGRFVMEKQVSRIEELYAEAADRRKDRLGAGVPVRNGAEGPGAGSPWVCFGEPKATASDNGSGDQSAAGLRGAAGQDQETVQGELPA